MKKSVPNTISTYKISLALIRIVIGLLIIFLGFSLNHVAAFLFKPDFQSQNFIFSYFAERIMYTSKGLTAVLAFSLIFLSVIEIIFGVALIKKKKWGLWGLFITTLAWIPLEIFFISKFITVSKTIEIIINAILIWLLWDIIHGHKEYFNK